MSEQPESKNKGFLTDDEGNPSSIRLMGWFSFAQAVILSGLYAAGKAQGDKMTDIIFLFLLGAFAPKAIQKFAEKWRGG